MNFDYMDVTISVEMDLKFKTNRWISGMDNTIPMYVGFNFEHNHCVVFVEETGAAETWKNVHYSFPFRVYKDTLQYHDCGRWNMFDDKVQTQYINYVADKELIDE